jgi:hypothetical protein
MLQLNNTTGLAATIFAAPNPDGIDSLYTIIKGTYALNRLDAAGFPVVAEEQVPPVLADEYHGDPIGSSVRVPSDLALIKPATDVVLAGTAYAPHGRTTTWMDVSVSVGPLRKDLRVFGDRFWRSGEPTPPQAFERMPLVWERAFGGIDTVKDKLHGEARNPVGTGFRAPHGEKPLEDLPLPNLEDPHVPISSWKDRPAPVGFAPVAAHWEPRKSFAGTFDEPWQKNRAPYLPKDFDPRFFQVAPEGLIASGYLGGGEIIDISGATPGGRLAFRLPAVRWKVDYVMDGSTESPPLNLDTVLIEPDLTRVILVWRTVLACDKKLLKVREITAQAA